MALQVPPEFPDILKDGEAALTGRCLESCSMLEPKMVTVRKSNVAIENPNLYGVLVGKPIST